MTDLEKVLEIVRDWVAEANDLGGVDAGDLTWRLEEAGLPLPSPVPEGQDSRDTGPALSRDVSAFLAVTEDRVPEAQRIVKGMSGRDRAVLSFWLQELSRIVEDAELSRRI